MRQRSADGGSSRKPNWPPSSVGIFCKSQRRRASPGPARPRKCLNGLGVATTGMDLASRSGEAPQTRGERHPGEQSDMKTKILGLLAVGLLAGPVAANAVNLVTNGGFESGLTGWTCSAPGGGCSTGTQSSIAAFEGSSYFYGFDNVAPPGQLQQMLATDIGGVYQVSLAFNTNGTVPPNTLSLSAGDLNTSLGLAQRVWNTFTGTFTAPASSTALNLFFSTVPGSLTVFVDAVSVSRVPEPGTLALLGLGLAGLGLSRRRKAS